MSVYNLENDEVVLLRDDNVNEGMVRVSLILTDRNLIVLSYGFFGVVASTEYLPLNKLKSHNGKPNVLIGKNRGGYSGLQLYFENSERFFRFNSFLGDRKWLNAITKAFRENMARQKKEANPGLELNAILDPLKRTLESAVNVVTGSQKEAKMIKMKCPKCGAELDGEKGKEVICGYCDAHVVIK